MRQNKLRQAIGGSLLAVMVVSPFSSVQAEITISGNSQLKGGLQANAPTTLNVLGNSVVQGNILVTQPFIINADPLAAENAFTQSSFTLAPSQPGMTINFGGITTGPVTIGNNNVGQVQGADGITNVETAPGVNPGGFILNGAQLLEEKNALQALLQGIDDTQAAAAQEAYRNEGGDVQLTVYTDVTSAMTSLHNAQTAGQAALDSSTATVSDIQAMKTNILNAQTALQSKVSQLEISTLALKDLAAALAQAKSVLSSTIDAVNLTSAQTAQTNYEAIQGDSTKPVYTAVTAAIQSLTAAKLAGKALLDGASATLEDVQAATEAIHSASSALTAAVTLLNEETQVLTEAAATLNTAKNDLTSTLQAAGQEISNARDTQGSYTLQLGDTDKPVYTDVTTAIENLVDTKTAGETVIGETTSTLQQIKAATEAITSAKSALMDKVALLDAETQALSQAREEAKQALSEAISSVNLTGATQTQAAYTNKGGDPAQGVYTDVTTAIAAVQQAKTDAQALNPGTVSIESLHTAANTLQDAIADLQEKVSALQAATDALVIMTISSKPITQFDFSTHYAGQTTAISKPMETSSFQGNAKHFTIFDGTNTIPIDLYWDIPQNEFATTYAASIGSAVESEIQQYFIDHGGVEALMNRTVSAGVVYDGSGQGNTFKIQSFKPGSAEIIKLGGDWQYFFDTDLYHGTDEDTSKNRTFTVSDQTHTAAILLNWNYKNMDSLVKVINDELVDAGVQASVQKVDEQTFKLVAKKANITITVDGTNKSDFF